MKTHSYRHWSLIYVRDREPLLQGSAAQPESLYRPECPGPFDTSILGLDFQLIATRLRNSPRQRMSDTVQRMRASFRVCREIETPALKAQLSLLDPVRIGNQR